MTDQTPSPLPRLMRHTTVAALGVTTVGFVLALALGSPMAALGIVIGLLLTVLNFRLMDRAVAAVHLPADADKKAMKGARNQIARATGSRLGLATVGVIVTYLVSKELGLGTAIGAALSQLTFVVNAYGVVSKEGGLLRAGEQNV